MPVTQQVRISIADHHRLLIFMDTFEYMPTKTCVVAEAITALFEGRIIPRGEVCSCDQPAPFRRDGKDHCSRCELLIVQRKIPK